MAGRYRFSAIIRGGGRSFVATACMPKVTAAGLACADRGSGSGFAGSTAGCAAAGGLLFSPNFTDCIGKQYRVGAGVGNCRAVGTCGRTAARVRRVSAAACCLADGAGADAGTLFCRPAVQHGGYRQAACLLFCDLLCSAVCVGGFSLAAILEQQGAALHPAFACLAACRDACLSAVSHAATGLLFSGRWAG